MPFLVVWTDLTTGWLPATGLVAELSAAVSDLTELWITLETGSGGGGAEAGRIKKSPAAATPAAEPTGASPNQREPAPEAAAASSPAETGASVTAAAVGEPSNSSTTSSTVSFRIPKRPPAALPKGATVRSSDAAATSQRTIGTARRRGARAAPPTAAPSASSPSPQANAAHNEPVVALDHRGPVSSPAASQAEEVRRLSWRR